MEEKVAKQKITCGENKGIQMEEKIIEFIRENKMFYDKRDKAYKNVILKDRKWAEFAGKENVSVDVVKKRWKTMRDRFYRVKKVETSVPSGSGQMNLDRAKYKFFDMLMIFLDDVEMTNKRTSGNFDEEADANNTFIEYDGSFEDVCEQSFSEYSQSITTEQSSTHASSSRKRKRVDDVEAEMLGVLKELKTGTGNQNVTPFRAFLESIALLVEGANLSIAETAALQNDMMNLVRSILF